MICSSRNSISALWLAVLFSCAASVQAQTEVQRLEKTFALPPDDARVMMRWWWFGPAVTKTELGREIEQMKAGGFGGFEIQPVYALALDDPKSNFRNLPYLSDEFLDDVRYANDTARSLGMRASLTLSSGWPYGGPHTPVTDGAAKLQMIQTPVAKGINSLPVPSLGDGESLIALFLADAGWISGHATQAPFMLPLPPNGALRLPIPPDAASGQQILLWFVSARTGQQVKRAAVDADGFVLDHFSREAVDHHLHNVADKLIAAFGDHPPYSVFSDSLEVYSADWTPGLLAQFRQRRGYDLLPHLPELFSANPTEEALAVRHDWGQTLTELVNENYLKPISAWAAAHHTLFSSQSYGEPAVSLSSNALVDLPEGEGPQWRHFSYTRWATSASHVYGRPITSAETWTWLHSPAFRATPLDMKAEADRFFLQGVNQLVGHGWPYSPPWVPEPGWRFYAAGVFNAHNPWWIVMPDIASYLQRASWTLRQGDPANDVAIYLPEDDAYAAFTPGKVSLSDLMSGWVTPALTQAIEDGGYNFDYIDSAAISARGIHYPLLILPDVDRLSPSIFLQIRDYVQAGGKVIAVGRLPSHVPGLQLNARASGHLASDVQAFFGSAGLSANLRSIRDASQLEQTLRAMIPEDVHLAAPAPEVGFIHRKLSASDIYFIANTGNLPVDTRVQFHSSHRAGEWLDADTGQVRAACMDESGTQLTLAPYESRILVLHDGPTFGRTSNSASDLHTISHVAELIGAWSIHFVGNIPDETMSSLVSWTDRPNTFYYSGIATYRKTFNLTLYKPDNTRVVLNFGTGQPLPELATSDDHPGMQARFDPPIREAAVIYVNGKRAGSIWHPPYELDITSLVKPGDNDLEVRVANTAINRLAGQSMPDYRLLWERYGQRFTPQDLDNLQPLPSGLLGKVKLITSTVQ